jgi:hypothetical protein
VAIAKCNRGKCRRPFSYISTVKVNGPGAPRPEQIHVLIAAKDIDAVGAHAGDRQNAALIVREVPGVAGVDIAKDFRGDEGSRRSHHSSEQANCQLSMPA